MSTPIKKNGWALIHMKTKAQVMVGDEVKDFRGDPVVVASGEPPHNSDSTGRIYTDKGYGFYPSVCDLVWVKEEA